MAAPREVEIVGMDYAFRAPSTLPGGRTTFGFSNTGKVGHELNIGLLKRDVTVQQFVDAMNAGRPVAEVRETSVGVLFAEPGTDAPSALSTDLLPGRTYIVICINKDTPDSKRHTAMGMFSTITVGPRLAGVSPAPPVDSVIGADYAFTRYPRTLAPGRHYFGFANEGKVRHEAYMILLAPGATVQKLAEMSGAGVEVDSLVAAHLGVLVAQGGTSPLGLLRVDLLPGRDYAIVCNFSDSPGSPKHVMLGMFGSIHVSAVRTRH
ncbi:MAG: hypothetical protein ABIP93_15020 [Gemmatimonadaceae bacterium]